MLYFRHRHELCSGPNLYYNQTTWLYTSNQQQASVEHQRKEAEMFEHRMDGPGITCVSFKKSGPEFQKHKYCIHPVSENTGKTRVTT